MNLHGRKSEKHSFVDESQQMIQKYLKSPFFFEILRKRMTLKAAKKNNV